MRYNYFSIFKYCYIINHRMTAAACFHKTGRYGKSFPTGVTGAENGKYVK